MMKLVSRKLFSFLATSSGEEVLNPIYEALTIVGPYALGIVTALCFFYGVFLGVKYARADSPDQKANTQKVLINFVIGAFIVIVLIAILYAIRQPLADFING